MKYIELRAIEDFELIDIEYKKLYCNDFEGFECDCKNLLPNDEGFIYDKLEPIINQDLYTKNTFVVNAGVGQGKSYAVTKIIEKYITSLGSWEVSSPDISGVNIVLIAPFKTLIEQYYNALIDLGIDKNSIFDYRSFDSSKEYTTDYNPKKFALNHQIHIITVKSFLGDYGDNAVQQSKAKREYLTALLAKCENKNEKLVLIFDEIHDSISTFKNDEYLLNLWRFQPVIQKIYALSATYNEASKVIIKQLASLTDKRINIVDFERIKIDSKQANLHLVFEDTKELDSNFFFKNLITEQLKKGKQINILTYSKKLAKALVNEESAIGGILSDMGLKVNLCIADTKKAFDKSVINIGTNFKTGISIHNPNSAFFVILPSSTSSNNSQNPLGIFTDGINSIIQAIARPRNGGDIFIVTPLPHHLIEDSDNAFDEEMTSLAFNRQDVLFDYDYLFKRDNSDIKSNEYQPLNKQGDLCNAFYLKKVNRMQEGFRNMEKENIIVDKPQIEQYDKWLLKEGERYLSTHFLSYGQIPASYILWAALHEQFLNCTLKGAYFRKSIYLGEEDVTITLLEEFYTFYTPEKHSSSSDKYLLIDFIQYLKSIRIKCDCKKDMLRYILTVLQIAKRNNYKRPNPLSINYTQNSDFLKDDSNATYMDRDFYINSSIFHACNATIHKNMREEEKLLIKAYQELGQLKKQLALSIFKGVKRSNSTTFSYFIGDKAFLELLENEPSLFFDKDLDNYCRVIKTIKEKDVVLKAFSFFDKMPTYILSEMTENDKRKWKKSIYSNFKKIFYEFSSYKTTEGITLDPRHLALPSRGSRVSKINKDKLKFINESLSPINLVELKEGTKDFGILVNLTGEEFQNVLEELFFLDPNIFDEHTTETE